LKFLADLNRQRLGWAAKSGCEDGLAQLCLEAFVRATLQLRGRLRGASDGGRLLELKKRDK
jgi:hypothetical protein